MTNVSLSIPVLLPKPIAGAALTIPTAEAKATAARAILEEYCMFVVVVRRCRGRIR
jgi:hypothetical protein